MCSCKNNINSTTNSTNNVISSTNVLNTNCNISQEYLFYLRDLLELNLYNNSISESDLLLLRILQGQVLSGLNLNDYCFMNYIEVGNNIKNIINKYE